MAEPEDGNEIFEITDFTTATELERFIARIEEVIHEWKLTQEPFDFSKLEKFDINLAEWKEMVDEISFADFPFLITRHSINPPPRGETPVASSDSLQQEASHSDTHHKKEWPISLKSMHNNRFDFPGKAHCLCRWYGLTDFVVISPKSYSLTNQDRINAVMSAITCAIQNSSCMVPVFLQAREEWRKYYLGTFQCSNVVTSFDMVHLKRIPNEYKHLYGLLQIFKQKLSITAEPANKAIVSIRLTYILQDWEEYMFDWPQAPPDIEGSGAMESAAVGFTSIDCLPFGACEDPVEDMYLFATWANYSEGVIADTEVFSELEAPGAPQWTVRVTMSPNTPCLLADCLQKFMAVCGTKATFDQVLGRQLQQVEENENVAQISNALERLTDPQTQYNIPSLSKVTKAVTDTGLRLSARSQQESPIPVSVLNKILMFLFPDAKTEEDDTQSEEESSKVRDLKEMFRFFKTAPVDSLVYRLAVCSCVVNFAFGGLKAVSHIWHEFVLEMRYRLENSVLLPSLEKGAPNLALGILYQKLQMLNCCIEQKIQRNNRSKAQDVKTIYTSQTTATSSTSTSSADEPEPSEIEENTPDPNLQVDADSTAAKPDSGDADSAAAGPDSGDSDESEEFYECDSTVKSDEEEDGAQKSSSQSLFEESVQYEQPQGRLRQLEKMTLLNADNEPLYIPETQEPAPMTEDILAEHAEVLTRLGTSAEGANLRARMQSASLLSDMESFKAANPGCVLEDFVRWYSPRDYIIESIIDKDTGETVEKGTLSERMLAPGNMWQEVWDSAKPTPARRQKRLFNDTKEAERVLHFLSNLSPAQVGLYLLPIVCQAALVITKSQEECLLMPSIISLLDMVTSKLEKKTRLASQSASNYSDVVSQLQTAELVIARARSLNLKFACSNDNKEKDDIKNFVLQLMQQEEVNVIGAARGPVGKAIHKMFVDAKSMRSNTSDDISAQYTKTPDSVDLTDDSVYPPPAAKEFILRTEDPRPAPYSEHLPHRMYCTLVDGKEYRLAGAFSSDSTFI